MNIEDFDEQQRKNRERLVEVAADPTVLKSRMVLASKRKSVWPFEKLRPGECVKFDMELNVFRKYAHSYGQSAGKKFRTWCEWPVLFVQRIE